MLTTHLHGLKRNPRILHRGRAACYEHMGDACRGIMRTLCNPCADVKGRNRWLADVTDPVAYALSSIYCHLEFHGVGLEATALLRFRMSREYQ